jgi:hypothetical protein
VNQTTLPYQLKVSNNAIPQVLKLEKSQSSLLSLSCILSLTSPCTNLSASTSKAMHTENFPFKIDSFSSMQPSFNDQTNNSGGCPKGITKEDKRVP